MAKNGLLIHYDLCTGCHSCEVACKREHEWSEGIFGIKVAKYGPEEYAPKQWDYIYSPFLTSSCNLCADRANSGKEPTCVMHCQSKVMHYGPLDELITLAEGKEKVSIFAPLA